jgi:hypothetical protein
VVSYWNSTLPKHSLQARVLLESCIILKRVSLQFLSGSVEQKLV